MTGPRFRLPVSGVVLGVLVDALGIRPLLEERRGTSPGSLRSVFSGERVKRETTVEAIAAIVDVVWPPDLTDALQGRPDLRLEWRDCLRESLLGMIDAWDAGRANLSTGYPDVARWDFAVLPWIRLATVDVALRWAFFLRATDAPLPTREWIQEFVEGRAFSATLQALRTQAKLTREQLAEGSGTDPDDWLDGERLPQFSKLSILAATIARAFGEAAGPGIERRIWFKLLAARAASALHRRIFTGLGDRGPRVARDFALGCAQLMRFLRAYVRDCAPPHSPSLSWLHVAQGVRGPWAPLVLEAAAKCTQFPHESIDLRGASADWGEVVSHWYRSLSEPDEALDSMLAKMVPPGLSELSAASIKEYLLQFPLVLFPHERLPLIDSTIAATSRLDDVANNERWRSEAEQRRDWPKYVAHSRRLVELEPANAKFHFWLGAALCEYGDYAAAIHECEIASQLNDGWVLPAAEVGIIHLRAGRPELALPVLRDVAAKYLPQEANGRTAAHVRYHEALALLWLGRTADAVQVLRDARDLDPANADVAQYLAHSLLLCGERREGRAVAKMAAHLGRRKVLEALDRGDYDSPCAPSRTH